MPLTIHHSWGGRIRKGQGDGLSVDGGGDGSSIGGSRRLVDSNDFTVGCRVGGAIGHSRGIDGHSGDSQGTGNLAGSETIRLCGMLNISCQSSHVLYSYEFVQINEPMKPDLLQPGGQKQPKWGRRRC